MAALLHKLRDRQQGGQAAGIAERYAEVPAVQRLALHKELTGHDGEAAVSVSTGWLASKARLGVAATCRETCRCPARGRLREYCLLVGRRPAAGVGERRHEGEAEPPLP